MRTAIVIGVGASRGLGGALARRCGREGLHVLVAGRTAAKLEAVAAEIRGAGGEASAVVADATSGADVTRLFDAAEKVGGAPALAIYNAGNNRISPLLEMSD